VVSCFMPPRTQRRTRLGEENTMIPLEEMRRGLLRGEKVFVVIGDDFFKASVYGEDLKMHLIQLTTDEVLSEIRRRMNEEV